MFGSPQYAQRELRYQLEYFQNYYKTAVRVLRQRLAIDEFDIMTFYCYGSIFIEMKEHKLS